MRFSSLCLAFVFVSSTVFAQAKPSDLAPTPVTQSAGTGAQQASPHVPTRSVRPKAHKVPRQHAKVGKKRLNTASAKAKRAARNSAQ